MGTISKVVNINGLNKFNPNDKIKNLKVRGKLNQRGLSRNESKYHN